MVDMQDQELDEYGFSQLMQVVDCLDRRQLLRLYSKVGTLLERFPEDLSEKDPLDDTLPPGVWVRDG
jgi:hypothetical protein